jgi:hypothetical protein
MSVVFENSAIDEISQNVMTIPLQMLTLDMMVLYQNRLQIGA